MTSIAKTVSKQVVRHFIHVYTDRLYSEVDNIKSYIMKVYKDELSTEAADYEGLAHPDNFIDIFEIRLDEYEFVRFDTGEKVPTLYIPSIESFDYGEELSVLKYMMEGVAGAIYELPEEDIERLLNIGGVDPAVENLLENLTPMFGAETPEYLKFRFVPDVPEVMVIEGLLGRKLLVFPFSEGFSVDIFELADQYVVSNRHKWEEESLTKAIKALG